MRPFATILVIGCLIAAEPCLAIEDPARNEEAAARAHQAALAQAAAGAYKTNFFDNDFAYLSDGDYAGSLLGENFKQLKPAPCVTFSAGGQYRARFHSEHNMRGLGLTGLSDDFLLHRTRLYADLVVGERLRFYGEFMDAVSEFEEHTPRAIEENRATLQNGFVDLRLLDNGAGGFWGRVGRQELLYGDQRLVSPLDWANTRRTFDGAKLFWRGEDWDIDGFWTEPVQPTYRSFDEGVPGQQFYGIYSTCKRIEDHTLDLYYLGFTDDDGPVDFNNQTLGSRWLGRSGRWLGTIEGGYQFGDFGDFDHAAGFYTVGLGHEFSERPWKPSVWCNYDWANGSEHAGNGFNHLFPLGHKYMGFMDLFARRNIQTPNLQFTATPAKTVSLLMWYYVFWLQTGEDVPYNLVNGTTPTNLVPGGDTYLGQEIDVLLTWQIRPRAELSVGYSHFFAGEFYKTNPTPGLFNGDADFCYSAFTLNF